MSNDAQQYHQIPVLPEYPHIIAIHPTAAEHYEIQARIAERNNLQAIDSKSHHGWRLYPNREHVSCVYAVVKKNKE